MMTQMGEKEKGTFGTLRMPISLVSRLQCPHDTGKLDLLEGSLKCSLCQNSFPIFERVPIILRDGKTVFNANEIIKTAGNTIDHRTDNDSSIKSILRRLLPTYDRNLMGGKNIVRMCDALRQENTNPAILIVGSGQMGQGVEQALQQPGFICIESDVYFNNRVHLVADGHDIPFLDATFDAVICQAVLEHVIDPERCVSEIHRVLKPQGWIYSEIPFMQQVHMAAYDFTRFTLLGQRHLFRRFKEVDAGISCGPGMALGWAVEFFFGSFFSSPRWRSLIRVMSRCSLFWLAWLDHWLIRSPSATDAASGFYFMGRKSNEVRDDREILRTHWSYR